MSFAPPSPPPPSPPAFPPGWYPDPSAAGNLRWWDGTQWTAHQQAMTASSYGMGQSAYGVQDPGQWTAVDYLVPTGKNSGARALFWGIFAQFANVAFLIPGVIAIISGAIGIARANRLEREGLLPTGRRRSIAGLVLGIVATITTAVGFVLLLTNLR